MTDRTADGGPGLFRLIYRSRMRLAPAERDHELGAIFLSARSFNKDRDVTGALLISDETFVQALEGEETTVRGLYDHIEKDARHDQVTVVDARAVDGRAFGRWAMAKVSGDAPDSDIPLIAERRRGVVAAAGRPTTADQDAVLEVMHEAAEA